MIKFLLVVFLLPSFLWSQVLPKNYETELQKVIPKVVDWRRDLHKNPELSNREFKTQEKIVNHLKNLGIEYKIYAKTGVVGIIRGSNPGKCIGLRADMDALPVKERADLPFKSNEQAEYLGATVPVMHACGHDAHVAMLMGTAEVLSKLKNEIAGTVLLVFQPAEEGPPGDEEGGAALMIKEGALDNPKPEAMYGIHIESWGDLGKIYYKPESFMASSDWFTIKVKGKQAHGSKPWMSVDPIVVSTNIVNALQTIVSRQVDLTKAPAVITVGKINSGVRPNIIPEEAVMEGTIRTLDAEMQKTIHQKLQITAENIAKSFGATAEVTIDTKTLVTYNNPKLVNAALPSLQKALGNENVIPWTWQTGAEDFSFYGQKCPAFFFYLGARSPKLKMSEAPDHHTPDFYIDDSRLDAGIRAFCQLVFDGAVVK